MDNASPSRFDAMLAEIRPVLAGVSPAVLQEAAGMLAAAKRIFLAGAGRSGLVVRMFGMRLAQADFRVHIVGDTTTPAIEHGDVLLIASGSGRTSTMRAFAARACGEGAKIIVMTYTPDSPIGLEADCVIHIPVPLNPAHAGGLDSAQPLGSLFDQTLFLTTEALLREALDQGNIDDASMKKRHANLE